MAKYEDQKANKPVVDDLIKACLDGEMKCRAENFVAFLREKKMSPLWGSINSFNISYKGKRVCIMKVNHGNLDIRLNTQYSENFNTCFSDAEKEIQEFLLNTITYCSGCGTCKPGIAMTLLSKEIKNACFNPVIQLINPDDKYLALAKKLVLLRVQEIREGNAPKVTYISMKKR